MSCTEIYGVNSKGEVIFVNEIDNAFRGAMHVWLKLSERYNIQGGMFGGFQRLWKLADTGTLGDFENIVLKSTFDNVVVKNEDIPLLLEAFRDYDKHYPNSSLLEQAEIIEKEIFNNKDMIAVCWNQTSINSNPWRSYDEETDECKPYNILNEDKHWFLSSSLINE